MSGHFITNKLSLISGRIAGIGAWLHIGVYVACVISGLLYTAPVRFSSYAGMDGDQWEYQTIAVNAAHGHGFPICGACEDAAAYRMRYDPAVPFSHTWDYMYGPGRGFDFYRNPLYPLFAAGVYRVCGVRPDLLREVQLILLILAGSLLPYLCYRLSGVRGIAVGISAYSAFLLYDSYYASEIMCEALITVHTILLLLASVVLDYRHRIWQALLMGAMLGTGLLLKNCYQPLVIIIIAHAVYTTYISHSSPRWYAMVLIAGIAVVVLPWTAYAHYELAMAHMGHTCMLLTTQGADVLLGSNNEYAADGIWHPEWCDHADSFYRQGDMTGRPAWLQVIAFYTSHLRSLPFAFSSKVLKGLADTVPQMLFYKSAMAFVVVYLIRRRLWLLVPVAFIFAVAALMGHQVHDMADRIVRRSGDMHHMMRYAGMAITAVCLVAYFYLQVSQRRFTGYFALLLLADYVLLTIVYYGNARITGVVDFICLILAFHNMFEVINMAIDTYEGRDGGDVKDVPLLA